MNGYFLKAKNKCHDSIGEDRFSYELTIFLILTVQRARNADINRALKADDKASNQEYSATMLIFIENQHSCRNG
jgi:hypothetical protein